VPSSYTPQVAVEPETGIITGVEPDPRHHWHGPAGVALLADEQPGRRVLGDSVYGSGAVRADLAEAGHIAVIKPWPTVCNPHLGADQFHRDDFCIDYTARTVTCRNGITVTSRPHRTATFGAKCRGCPLRSRCTADTRRQDVQR
jgi:hypothetical protein